MSVCVCVYMLVCGVRSVCVLVVCSFLKKLFRTNDVCRLGGRFHSQASTACDTYRTPNCIICAPVLPCQRVACHQPPPLHRSLTVRAGFYGCSLHARASAHTKCYSAGVCVSCVVCVCGFLARMTRVKCAGRVHISATGSRARAPSTPTTTRVEFSDVFCRIHLTLALSLELHSGWSKRHRRRRVIYT